MAKPEASTPIPVLNLFLKQTAFRPVAGDVSQPLGESSECLYEPGFARGPFLVDGWMKHGIFGELVAFASAGQIKL